MRVVNKKRARCTYTLVKNLFSGYMKIKYRKRKVNILGCRGGDLERRAA